MSDVVFEEENLNLPLRPTSKKEKSTTIKFLLEKRIAATSTQARKLVYSVIFILFVLIGVIFFFGRSSSNFPPPKSSFPPTALENV